MKPLHILIVAVILTNIFGCNRSKPKITDNLRDSIVIIFNNPPNQKYFYYNSGAYAGRYKHSTLKFIGDGGLFQNFDPLPQGDTLTIPCFGQDFIVISHQYKGQELHEFLVKHGDTITINYDISNFPHLASRLSPRLTDMYNLNHCVKNRTANFGFEPQTILSDIHFGMVYLVKNKSKSIPADVQNAMQENLVDYINLDSTIIEHKKFVESYRLLLDSLELSQSIDSVYLKFYRNKLDKIIAKGNIKDWLANPKSKKLNINKETDYGIALNDNCAYDYYYQIQLENYMRRWANKEGIKQYTTSNSKFADYRTVFDSIAVDETIPPKSKAVLLAYCFDEICENFKVDDKLSYLSKYLKITSDTAKFEIIKERNRIDTQHTEDLLLIDSNGKVLTLNDAIATHKGKVVYLDFWAPWCSPCREEMANAERLHKLYKDKELIFMNVVVYDTKNSWDKIKIKFEKNRQVHYYFATNSQSSRQLNALKVDLIPHFMIIDRMGRLVITNAKRPGNKEVCGEINSFL